MGTKLHNRDAVKACRDEFLRMADAMQNILDGKTTQTNLGKTIDRTPSGVQNQVATKFHAYIKTRLLGIPDLRAAIERTRTSGDLLMLRILEVDPEKTDELVVLPEYDEDELWKQAGRFLSERQLRVMKYLTGRDLDEPLNLSETANRENVTVERIRQVAAKTARILRNADVIAVVIRDAKFDGLDALNEEKDKAERAIQRYRAVSARYENARRILTEAANKVDGILAADKMLPDSATSVNNVGMSARTANCLHRAGYHTLESVAALDADTILRIPYIGPNGVGELANAISRHLGVDRTDLLAIVKADERRQHGFT